MKTILLISLLFISKLFYAQGTWVQQNPEPVLSMKITDIYFFTDSLGFGVGGYDVSRGGNSIVSTTDKGQYWKYIVRTDASYLNGISFVGRFGCVVGNKGYIATTPDSGKTWVARQSNTTKNLRDVVVLTSKDAYAVGDSGAIVITQDTGKTWNDKSLSNVFPVIYYFTKIFMNKHVGWAIAPPCNKNDCSYPDNSIIYKTTDNGNSWLPDHIGVAVRSIYFADDNIGYAVGGQQSGEVHKTTDGGLTWVVQTNHSHTAPLGGIFLDVAFHDQNLGWAVGGGGTGSNASFTMKTNDSGVTWNDLPGCGGGNVISSPKSGRNVFISNFNYAINYIDSTNECSPLTLSNGFYQGEGVSFADSLNGWAVDLSGNVIHTINGGKKWLFEAKLPETGQFYVDAVTPKLAWIVSGSDNNIYKRNDAGVAWDLMANAPSGTLSSIYFLDAMRGYAVGNDPLSKNGIVIRTLDSGLHWDKYSYPDADSSDNAYRVVFSGVKFVNDKEGWVVGYKTFGEKSMPKYEGIILKTIDGGDTWASSLFPAPIEGISFIDSNNGWAGSHSLHGTQSTSIILSTKDGGSSWDSLDTPLPVNSMRSVALVGAKQRGWIMGKSTVEYIFDDQDFGANTTTLGTTNLRSMFFADAYHGWVCGWGGLIYSYVPYPADITISPPSLDFGTIRCDTTKELQVEVMNTGQGTADLDSAIITGGGFTVVDPVGKVTLFPNSSVTYTIRFSPDSSGSKNSVFQLVGAPYGVSVSCGLQGACKNNDTVQVGVVTITPSDLKFGTIRCDSMKDTTLIVKNTGTVTVYLDIAKVCCSEFTLMSPLGRDTINVGESVKYSVRFTPIVDSNHTGIFSITGSPLVSATSILSGACVKKQDTTSEVNGNKNPEKNDWLGQNYPNPFNRLSVIGCRLSERKGLFEVRDMLGRIVYQTIVDNATTEVQLETHSWSAGMYLYSLTDGVKMYSRSMVIIK